MSDSKTDAPTSMIEALKHEERLRVLETQVSSHEARCGERYEHIRSVMTDITLQLSTASQSTQKRLDLLMGAIVFISFCVAFGPEVATKLLAH